MNCNSIIMEYQNTINLLDNAQNQPTKFRIKNQVEINDDACETYNMYNIILNLKLRC